MNLFVFLGLLLGGIASVNVLVWVPIILWLKRKRTAAFAELQTELAVSGERTVLGPEQGLYRGGSGGYSGVSGNATLVLTDRRLIMVKVTGGRVDVPRERIASVRTTKSFRGGRRAGKVHEPGSPAR